MAAAAAPLEHDRSSPIVVTGATGFLGRHVTQSLAQGHRPVMQVSRQACGAGYVPWEELATVVDGAYAVVHLAGANVGRRWTERVKREILESRVQTTRALCEAVRAAAQPPSVVVSQSAVGFYGPHGDEAIGEEDPPGSGFLAEVCRAWEAEAAPIAMSTRLCVLRSGVVLARDGGAFARMLLPFRMGLGGPLGSGHQAFPWIHITDWVALVQFAIENAAAAGPMNAVAPGVVSNRAFARALGRALHRPAVLPTPGWALRLAFGEMATAMLLQGQRVLPRRALALGFRFRYSMVDEALRQLTQAK